MLCASWNVNGIRACARKGFREWMLAFSPDVLLLQETKVAPDDLPAELAEIPGYRMRLHSAEKKGYSGVAVYVRDEPDEWIEGLSDPAFDAEGRILWARYGDVLIGSAYFPNSQAEGRRLDYRLEFGRKVRRFLAGQRKLGRHVVLAGDYNVAHHEVDLARPQQNVKNPGFLPEERDWMSRFLSSGYVDTFRQRNPDATEAYSWWSYRAGSRERNVGWRLDYFCVDQDLWPRVRDAGILADVEGSDHCPVTLEFELPGGR